MKKIAVFIMILCISYSGFSQRSRHRDKEANASAKIHPKLIVGIVVDQMRYDFLYRYYDRLSTGGFKRLMDGGVNCLDMQYNYFPTNTGPGHASIFSGTPPAINGIAANDWYDRVQQKLVYCTEDSGAKGVGMTGKAGQMSPVNLKVTTLGDQVKLATGMRGKVFGIALKDRGAILPAGHSADAAYWFDGESGNWGTSDYYQNSLPAWVSEFNKIHNVETYINNTWNTVYPITSYVSSDKDDQVYENPLKGENKPIFPHQLSKGKNNNYEMIRTSPYGNTLTADFAIAAIKGEQLGKDDIMDFLSISFSSTDYVGHSFGPNSIESEDTYYRLDKDFERLLQTLDEQVGKGNYLLFLTADHGICDIPGHSHYYKLPGAVLEKKVLYQSLNDTLNRVYGNDKYILEYEDNQYYVNWDLLKQKHIDYPTFFKVVEKNLMSNDGIAKVFDLSNLANAVYPTFFINKIKNGINPKRSGDIVVLYEPGWIVGYTSGTSHGSMYEYDSHVPGIFYGWGLHPMNVARRVEITDLAPTIAALVRIMPPTGNIGLTIPEVVNAKK